MVHLIRGRRLSDEEERKITTALIVSDKVLRRLISVLDPSLFDLEYSRWIVERCIEFFNNYERAPKQHIQDIYDRHKHRMREQDRDLLAEFLQRLSDDYLKKESSGLNEDYLIDEARKYLHKQAISRTNDQVKDLLERGKIEEAYERFQQGVATAREADYHWVAPLDDLKFVSEVFSDKEEPLLELGPGLGKLTGPLRRGWLIGLMGFTKRGKTWMLQEIAQWALIQRRKTVWVSLEMQSTQLSERFYKQLVAAGSHESEYIIPVFDCQFNQDGTCKRPERAGDVPFPGRFNEREDTGYVPCIWCKNELLEEYVPAVWYEKKRRPKLTQRMASEHLKKLWTLYGKNLLRMISYPEGSANIAMIRRDLKELELEENFVPDIIIIDYADILKSENSKEIGRDAINTTWLALKGLASATHTIVISPTQTNRASVEAALVKEIHTGEDKRKLDHCDIMLGITQTDEEKSIGVARIGVVEHRWEEFQRNRVYMILQQLSLGQPVLDGHIMFYIPDDKRKKRKD